MRINYIGATGNTFFGHNNEFAKTRELCVTQEVMKYNVIEHQDDRP